MSTLLPNTSVRLENVSKSFGNRTVVSNVSFEVKPGETLVLLGTSGSGKTTTLRMINRLVQRDNGQIFFNDKSIDEHQPALLRRKIGYVLQDYGLFPHYTVFDNIAVVPRLNNWKPEQIKPRVESLMEKLHLPFTQFSEMYPTALSGGQKQRVSLARALAAQPSVLLMDEPYGALDPVTRASIRKEFHTIDEIKDKTVIMVTHDVVEAFELGTKICLMDQGQIQQIGTPVSLLFNPANDFVRSFFKEQRLLLELKALKLQDLKPWLHNTAQPSPHIITGQHSVWEALEETIGDTALAVEFEDGQRTVESHSLMHAISQYKQVNGNTANLS
jgi:osmoprotectant transport system ATP-binding protein